MQSGTPGRSAGLLVNWIFLAMGLLFLGGALIHAHFTRTFLRESVTVDGRIVGLKPEHRGRRHRLTFAPVFRFADENGHPVTVVSNTSSNPPAFKPGEAVKVHYRKDHPEDAKIDSFMQLWLGDVVFGCVGALLIGIGLPLMLAGRARSRPDVIAPGDGAGILRRG